MKSLLIFFAADNAETLGKKKKKEQFPFMEEIHQLGLAANWKQKKGGNKNYS